MPAFSATLSLEPRVHMNNIEEGENFSRLSGGKLFIDWKQEHRFFDFHLDARLQAENGQVDYRQTDNYAPQSKISLREGLVSAHAGEIATFRAGTIDQSRMDNEAVIGSQGFPGLMQEIRFEDEFFYTSLQAEQVIPNGVTTRKSSYSSGDSKSQLLYEKIRVGTQQKNKFKVGLFGGHYAFKGLSSDAAFESLPLGNRVRGLSSETAQFEQDFVGMEYGVEGSVYIGGFLLSSDYRVLESLETRNVSGDESKGFLGSLSLSSMRSLPQVYELGISRYYLPSRIGPSVFASKRFGYNNRQGFSGSLSISEPEEGMTYGMGATVAQEIIDSPLQDQFTAVTMYIGYSYVHIFGR